MPGKVKVVGNKRCNFEHKKPGGCTLHKESTPARFVTLKANAYIDVPP